MPKTDYETEDLAARDDEWAVAGDSLPPRPRRAGLTRAAIALSALLIATLGFIGGVEVQKHQGSTGATANAAAGGPGGAAAAGFQRPGGGAGGGGGAGFGAPGGGANVTVGTVSNKKGNVLYVKNSDGTLIKVKTASSSTITRTAKTSAGSIHPGDTVVVQGSTAKSGTITASRITATSAAAAAGRPALGGGGGFGGGGFGGGGAPGAPAGGAAPGQAGN
jgi:hypothetical protein